jgi:hypothetical protein
MVNLMESSKEFSMNGNVATRTRTDAALDAFAAELTDAAFPVALDHSAGTDWLDMQLELWRALEHAVKKLAPKLRDARRSF